MDAGGTGYPRDQSGYRGGSDWVPWGIGVGHMGDGPGANGRVGLGANGGGQTGCHGGLEWVHMGDGLGAMVGLPLVLGGLDWVPQESDWVLWGIEVGPTGGLGWAPWGRGWDWCWVDWIG